MVGQHPWVDRKTEFKAHLDSLEKNSLYENKDGLFDQMVENQMPEEVGDEEGRLVRGV